MRELYTRVERKAEFEEGVQRHMVMFNAFKLLEFTFKRGLQKNVDRKYIWADNTIMMGEKSLTLTKKMYLRMWIEQLFRN